MSRGVGSSRNRHLSTMVLYFSRTMNGLKNESWRSNSLSCPRVIASFLRTCGRRAIAQEYQIRLTFAQLSKVGFHSYRNATIGSTRVAFLAGTYAARIATVKKKAGTPRNDIGSRALTPNRIARNK